MPWSSRLGVALADLPLEDSDDGERLVWAGVSRMYHYQ
jgi:hypothetical protein